MLSWPALLLSPSIALLYISAAYAMTGHECNAQDMALLHMLAALCLSTSLMFTVLAAIRAGRSAVGRKSDDIPTRPVFVARMAVAIGALSTLVIAMGWVAQWMLNPCLQ